MKLFAKKELPVKLGFAACGKILIDGLRFSFSVTSEGNPSNKGLCVSFSGDAINDGTVTLTDFEYLEDKNGKIASRKIPMPLITKKDGKRIYQARLDKIKISDATQRVASGQTLESALSSIISKDIRFKVTPHYSGEDEPEVMLNVYPYENALTGSCTQWLKVTSDQDWFEHNLGK
ncbi:MAG: hypothetical protein II574_09785 [Ruminococcus sp.]|nr:hypothetical protein [Ruminococcus sp.]